MTDTCDRCRCGLDPESGYGNMYHGPTLDREYCWQCGGEVWERTKTASAIRALLTAHAGAPLTPDLADQIMQLADPDNLHRRNAKAVRKDRDRTREAELRSAANDRILTDAENQELIALTGGKYEPYTQEMRDADQAYLMEMADCIKAAAKEI